jgi:PAS domain S-box-containing protein
VTNAIRVQVTSLGDFPLDPDSGKAWLWSGGGERLLWMSGSARSEIGVADTADSKALTEASTFRGFLPLLALAAPDLEPIRVQQITIAHGQQNGVYTCLCRHVPLVSGGYGLLAVAIGAPARSMAAIREQEPSAPAAAMPLIEEPFQSIAPPAAPILPPEPARHLLPMAEIADRHVPVRDNATPRPEPMTAPVEAAYPVASHRDAQERPSGPAWTSMPEHARRPLRFVWQTDETGRFVHLSRELADAVGPANAMVIGQTWEQIIARHGILETDGISAGFRSRDTWTALPALWPVDSTGLGVPVEVAGMPVLEGARFAGFRGYGIARIERAVMRPASASAALAQDIEPVTEQPEERFGPAVAKQLAAGHAPVIPQDPSAKPGEARDLRPAPASTRPEPVQATIPVTAQAGTSSSAPVDPKPEQTLPAGSSLSQIEREAFREIAKSLAAMTPAAAQMSRQQDPEQTALAFPAAPVPRLPRPLDILKKDLLERGGLRLNPAPETGPKGDDPVRPASVIPFHTPQERRDTKPSGVALQSASSEIVERLPVGLMVMQQGRAVFANRALLDLAGYADLESFLMSGGAETLFNKREGEATDLPRPLSITSQAGSTIAVDATIQAITWDGSPATLTSLRRTTDHPAFQQQKALELELLASRVELQELHSVLETATDGVILLDSTGRILNLNRSAEALFGFDQNEIAGESITILLEPESHTAALDYIEGLNSHGVSSLLNDGRDVRGRERNGGVIPLFMTIGRVGHGQGSTKFCAVLRDITHWKKVEADLMDAKRAAEDSSAHKTDFLARISHEIRTPLNAIIGFSQVMMSESFGPVGNDRYKQYVKDINASGEHVVSLVNDLLDLSKVASGKLELSFGSVDLNAVVSACVSMIQPQANAGKVIVRSQLAANLPPVVADDRSIRQILLNLLSNAAKFTEAGGQVVVSTSLTERGEVTIRVRDTGIGMTMDDVKNAMEPFRQIPGPRSSGGTGLGLPLTKALVEANRAAFAIQSDPGKGTLVEVTFPSTRVLAE